MVIKRKKSVEGRMKEFHKYIKKRNHAFEYKHKLSTYGIPYYEMRLRNYPNNLKYLDTMSQWFIRYLNQSVASRRDKILTVFVYRFVGDKYLCRLMSNRNYVFGMQEVEKLARKLNKRREPLNNKYPVMINRRSKTKLNKGDALRVAVEDFLCKLPDDMFYNWTISKIYWYLMSSDLACMTDFLNYQLASDLSFINELSINIDLPTYVPKLVKDTYKEVTGKTTFDTREWALFVYDTMYWYRSQNFASNKQRIIMPYDVANMLLGFRLYTSEMGYSGVNNYRNYPRIKAYRVDDLVISRSMYDYYKEKHLHNKVNR